MDLIFAQGARWALVLAIVALACVPQNAGLGEEKIGDFTFVATTVEDVCLSARYPASLTFAASLTRTKDVLFFTGPGGTVRGTLLGRTFTVTYGGPETVDRACTLAREETITGTLDEAGRSMTGSYIARVLPQQGSNCTGLVLGAGRQFATLPCAVRYQLIGQRTDNPDGGMDGGTSDAGLPDAGDPDAGAAVDGGAPSLDGG
jgi:hypothetical protein